MKKRENTDTWIQIYKDALRLVYYSLLPEKYKNIFLKDLFPEYN